MSASKPSPIDAGAAALAEAGGAAGGAPAPAPRAGASLRRWVSGLVVAVILLAAAVAGCAVALGAQAGGSDSAAGTSSLAYAIVIDAGSSGSRVSIYTVQEVNGAAQDLLSTSGEKTEPGLSSYGADAAAAAASLRPLLDAAVAAVPPAERGATPVVVGATAGLRLLPGDQAEAILAAVRALLRDEYPFAVDPTAVRVLSGADEAAFAWVAINYLRGRIGAPAEATLATVELGGASAQEAFALTPAEAAAAPPEYVSNLGGYAVYTHSYLGAGANAARAAILAEGRAANGTHPCVPAGYDADYSTANVTVRAVGSAGGASAAACAAAATAALRVGAPCGVAPAAGGNCSFGGAWGGPRVPADVVALSAFWFLAVDASLFPRLNFTVEGAAAPDDYAAAAAAACALDLAGLEAAYPATRAQSLPFLCLDLSYAAALLEEGFSLPAGADLAVASAAWHGGEETDAGWPLGAAIDALV